MLFWPCLPLMLLPYLICNKSLLILILSGIETLHPICCDWSLAVVTQTDSLLLLACLICCLWVRSLWLAFQIFTRNQNVTFVTTSSLMLVCWVWAIPVLSECRNRLFYLSRGNFNNNFASFMNKGKFFNELHAIYTEKRHVYAEKTYSGAKKYLVSHQLCKFSHLKRWERPVIFIIGLPQLWETK